MTMDSVFKKAAPAEQKLWHLSSPHLSHTPVRLHGPKPALTKAGKPETTHQEQLQRSLTWGPRCRRLSVPCPGSPVPAMSRHNAPQKPPPNFPKQTPSCWKDAWQGAACRMRSRTTPAETLLLRRSWLRLARVPAGTCWNSKKLAERRQPQTPTRN